jgi:23S rRNA pseudouridine2457 synthase
MTAAAGLPTLRLIRFSIEGLTLDGLHPGQWRDLTPPELASLRRALYPTQRKSRHR